MGAASNVTTNYYPIVVFFSTHEINYCSFTHKAFVFLRLVPPIRVKCSSFVPVFEFSGPLESAQVVKKSHG